MSDEGKPFSDRKSPGFWFYTADFERDVMMLSLESQGLWIRMLCWMSDNEEHRGFCEASNGSPLSSGDISNRAGRSARRIQNCLDEMERLGIFSRDDRGCIYSRRMARDTHISEVRRAAAKSRHDTEIRAANGKFCSDFAPAKQNFAPAKVPANGMQNPTVTASVSSSGPDLSIDGLTADRWTDEERAVGSWMREFPGQSLAGEPDIAIVRRCLALGTVEKVKWAMRELGIERKAPGRSWAWFPVALASKLGVKRA